MTEYLDCKIKEIVQETVNHKTFFLDRAIEAKPGQFVMVWLPRVDEKPFTLSCLEKTAFTAEKKGLFTEKLFALKEGDFIGIRGPYGQGFELKNKACLVAGGCGAAPLAPLAEALAANNFTFYAILGAKTKEMLLFKERFKKASKELIVCTDDGSEGRKGFTTEALEELLAEKKIENVLTCGPEIMMKKVFDLCQAKRIECQASLERYFKCGIGICGQCMVNNFRVCKEGPVFSTEQLKLMTEFGQSARLKSGKKVSLKEYAEWRQK